MRNDEQKSTATSILHKDQSDITEQSMRKSVVVGKQKIQFTWILVLWTAKCQWFVLIQYIVCIVRQAIATNFLIRVRVNFLTTRQSKQRKVIGKTCLLSCWQVFFQVRSDSYNKSNQALSSAHKQETSLARLTFKYFSNQMILRFGIFIPCGCLIY